jgi:hypothetical protein
VGVRRGCKKGTRVREPEEFLRNCNLTDWFLDAERVAKTRICSDQHNILHGIVELSDLPSHASRSDLKRAVPRHCGRREYANIRTVSKQNKTHCVAVTCQQKQT